MSFKTIFQDTSSGNAIRQYFDTKFAAIESRLESIERMLGAQSRSEIGLQSECVGNEPEWNPDYTELTELTKHLPPIKQEPEWRPMELQKGNVIFTGGSKYVVRTPRSLEPTEKFICNRPHEDGDFSYLCGSDYCRCCS